jgi:hypothetical protein
VLVDDVIGERNLLERLCSCDDNLTSTENTTRNLLHVMGWLEFNLDRRVPIRLEGNFENVRVLFEPIRHSHEIDVIVETEVGVDHDNSKRVCGKFDVEIQEILKNLNKLCDYAFTIEEVTASGNLDTSIGEHLHGLGTV